MPRFTTTFYFMRHPLCKTFYCSHVTITQRYKVPTSYVHQIKRQFIMLLHCGFCWWFIRTGLLKWRLALAENGLRWVDWIIPCKCFIKPQHTWKPLTFTPGHPVYGFFRALSNQFCMSYGYSNSPKMYFSISIIYQRQSSIRW